METLGWCEMLWTGGNTPACTVAKSQRFSPSRKCSKPGNGPTGSTISSCLDANSDSRSPQVQTTAVQPAIALENLSAENSPGVHFHQPDTSSSAREQGHGRPPIKQPCPQHFRHSPRCLAGLIMIYVCSRLSFCAWCNFKNIF